MGRKPNALVKLKERVNVVSLTTINNMLALSPLLTIVRRPSDSMSFLYIVFRSVRPVFHLFFFFFPKDWFFSFINCFFLPSFSSYFVCPGLFYSFFYVVNVFG